VQLLKIIVAIRQNTLPDLLSYSKFGTSMLFATNLGSLNMFYRAFHKECNFIDTLLLLHTLIILN